LTNVKVTNVKCPGRPRKFKHRKAIIVYVDEDEYEMIKSLAKFKKTSISEIARTILRYHLNMFSSFSDFGKEPLTFIDNSEDEVESIIDGAIELRIRDNMRTMYALLRAVERNRHDREAMERLSKIMEDTINLVRKMKNPSKQILRELNNIVERARRIFDSNVTYVT